jgi:hypothetical protein
LLNDVLTIAEIALALEKYKFVFSVTLAVVRSAIFAFSATLVVVAYPSVDTLEYTLALEKYKLVPSGTTDVLSAPPEVKYQALPVYVHVLSLNVYVAFALGELGKFKAIYCNLNII